MRILHLTPYYTPAYAFGGVVRSVEGMTRALARRGHTVTVLTTDALSQSQRFEGATDELIDGIRVIRAANLFPWLRGKANLSTPLHMRRIARDILPQVDVIHCHEFRTTENLLVTPLAAGAGKPLVLSPHGTLTRSTGRGGLKTAWDRALSPRVARRFDHVIGLTEAEVDDVRALWKEFDGGASFSAIPNGVDPDQYAQLSGREDFRQRYGLGDAPICLFMGRLHGRKGVGLLAEAFKAADVPGARLVIAGPDEGMLASLQAQIDERIILTGYVNGADRLAALAAADLLALPAVGEGLPMIVLEAMAAGMPVIVTPGCYLPEVEAYGAGIQVEPELEPLRDGLRRLLTNAAERVRMGAAGQQLVRDRFTWDRAAERLEEVYEQVLSRVGREGAGI